MKCLAALLVIVTLGLTPVVVSAQGFVGPALAGPGSADRGSLFDGRGDSRACAESALGLGYLHHTRGVAFDFSGSPEAIPAPVQMAFGYPLTGLWTTGAAAVRLDDRIALAGALSYLVPTDVEPMKQVATLNNGTVASRSLEPHVNWWHVEGCGIFDIPGETISLTLGFRFDNFSTLFTNPTDPQNFPISNPSDETEIEIRSSIPYFGALVASGGGNARIVLGLVGSAYGFGNVKYGDSHNKNAIRRACGTGAFKSASFLEMFSEYSLGVGTGRAGVFALFSLLSAKGILNHRFVTAESVQTCNYRFSFTRRTWAVGCRFSVDFAIPGSLTAL